MENNDMWQKKPSTFFCDTFPGAFANPLCDTVVPTESGLELQLNKPFKCVKVKGFFPS